MNFSFELQGAALTGNVNPEAMMGISTVFGAFLGGLAMIRMIICLALGALMIVSRWRVFKKAGLPGRGILIPVYNIVLMFQLGGFSGRWTLSILFPPLLIVMMIINIFKIAKRFGKHWTYGLGMLFIKIVFVPILAFDDSTYLSKKSVVKKSIAKKIVAKKGVAKKIIKKARTTTSKSTKKVVKKVKTFSFKKK